MEVTQFKQQHICLDKKNAYKKNIKEKKPRRESFVSKARRQSLRVHSKPRRQNQANNNNNNMMINGTTPAPNSRSRSPSFSNRTQSKTPESLFTDQYDPRQKTPPPPLQHGSPMNQSAPRSMHRSRDDSSVGVSDHQPRVDLNRHRQSKDDSSIYARNNRLYNKNDSSPTPQTQTASTIQFDTYPFDETINSSNNDNLGIILKYYNGEIIRLPKSLPNSNILNNFKTFEDQFCAIFRKYISLSQAVWNINISHMTRKTLEQLFNVANCRKLDEFPWISPPNTIESIQGLGGIGHVLPPGMIRSTSASANNNGMIPSLGMGNDGNQLSITINDDDDEPNPDFKRKKDKKANKKGKNKNNHLRGSSGPFSRLKLFKKISGMGSSGNVTQTNKPKSQQPITYKDKQYKNYKNYSNNKLTARKGGDGYESNSSSKQMLSAYGLAINVDGQYDDLSSGFGKKKGKFRPMSTANIQMYTVDLNKKMPIHDNQAKQDWIQSASVNSVYSGDNGDGELFQLKNKTNTITIRRARGRDKISETISATVAGTDHTDNELQSETRENNENMNHHLWSSDDARSARTSATATTGTMGTMATMGTTNTATGTSRLSNMSHGSQLANPSTLTIVSSENNEYDRDREVTTTASCETPYSPTSGVNDLQRIDTLEVVLNGINIIDENASTQATSPEQEQQTPIDTHSNINSKTNNQMKVIRNIDVTHLNMASLSSQTINTMNSLSVNQHNPEYLSELMNDNSNASGMNVNVGMNVVVSGGGGHESRESSNVTPVGSHTDNYLHVKSQNKDGKNIDKNDQHDDIENDDKDEKDDKLDVLGAAPKASHGKRLSKSGNYSLKASLGPSFQHFKRSSLTILSKLHPNALLNDGNGVNLLANTKFHKNTSDREHSVLTESTVFDNDYQIQITSKLQCVEALDEAIQEIMSSLQDSFYRFQKTQVLLFVFV